MCDIHRDVISKLLVAPSARAGAFPMFSFCIVESAALLVQQAVVAASVLMETCFVLFEVAAYVLIKQCSVLVFAAVLWCRPMVVVWTSCQIRVALSMDPMCTLLVLMQTKKVRVKLERIKDCHRKRSCETSPRHSFPSGRRLRLMVLSSSSGRTCNTPPVACSRVQGIRRQGGWTPPAVSWTSRSLSSRTK